MKNNCANCGAEFIQRSKEGAKRFATRKFCSNRCVGLSKSARRKPPGEMVARYRRTKVAGRTHQEHRLVMEKVLGRPLLPTEQVHHKDHDRFNNDPSNLEVVTSTEHGQRHTELPTVKTCVICSDQFEPHKTKRRRQQTCSLPCRRALLSKRAYERYQKPAVVDSLEATAPLEAAA